MGDAREWLITNGTGSYAMGRPDRVGTRRYHGLYVQATHPPRHRVLVLSSIALDLTIGEQRWPLWAADWRSGTRGPGPRGRMSFSLVNGIPHYRWDLGPTTLVESIWLVPGFDGVIVHYRWQSPNPATLHLTPLFGGRDHHRLGGTAPKRLDANSASFVTTWDATPWEVRAPGARFIRNPDWYRDFHYRDEAERGYPAHEDLWTPGGFDRPLAQGSDQCYLVVANDGSSADPAHLIRHEHQRRQSLSPQARLAEIFLADQSLGQTAIVAGYPWFADWSRDSLIALPGLTKALPEANLPERVLTPFRDLKLIPNRWPEGAEESPGHAVDAPLWFVVQASRMAINGHLAEPKSYLEAIDAIVRDYVSERIPGIRVDPADGLLSHDEGQIPLTWMDASLAGRAVTPRPGKAVEIQALWYNALQYRDALAERIGEPRQFRRACQTVYRSFNRLFPNPDGTLKDTLDSSERRPNQLYAVGLPYPLAEPHLWDNVISMALQHLYRPFGLLSLDEGEPGFRKRYGPGISGRDLAYHQGMAWPYLLGIFFDALSRTRLSPYRPQLLSQVAVWFHQHLDEAGLGGVSEICQPEDGTPVGAPFQAWSVAELLRLQPSETTD